MSFTQDKRSSLIVNTSSQGYGIEIHVVEKNPQQYVFYLLVAERDKEISARGYTPLKTKRRQSTSVSRILDGVEAFYKHLEVNLCTTLVISTCS